MDEAAIQRIIQKNDEQLLTQMSCPNFNNRAGFEEVKRGPRTRTTTRNQKARICRRSIILEEKQRGSIRIDECCNDVSR